MADDLLLDLTGEGDAALTLLAPDIFPTRITADGYWTPAPIPAGTVFETPDGRFRLTEDLDARIAVIGGRHQYELDQPVELEAIRE